jgi:hypothetical protein
MDNHGIQMTPDKGQPPQPSPTEIVAAAMNE